MGSEAVQTIPRPIVTTPEEERFYAAAEKYLDGMLRLNPTASTYYGYHRYDGDVEDYGPAGIRARAAFYSASRAAFSAFDPSSMSPGAAIDLDLVRSDIDASLFALTDLKSHEQDPYFYNEIVGYGTLLLTGLGESDPAWPRRLSSLLSRMGAIPRLLADARRNLRRPSRVVTEFTIERNRGNISFFRETLPPLYARDPSLEPRLREEGARVLEALEAYQRFLETDLLPRSDGDWRLGKDLWRRKLRHTLQSDIAPETIVERAWARLRSEREAMLRIAEPLHAALFPGHVHPESGDDRINVIVPEVLGEVGRRHSTPETLFRDVKEKWVRRARSFVRKADLVGLPPEDDNFVVERTPGFLDGLAVAFFNPPPAFEPHLKKSFWISSITGGGDPARDAARTESLLREYNDYGLQSVTIHEAFPGHYVQFHHALSSPYASIYKKIFANNTFAEGWAVLCEVQMFEAGYAEGEPECLLVHKKINLRTPLNAILDARLHTEPMSDEEADRWALDLMQRYGFQEEAEAAGKLRRAKVTSTQLSTYFVGFLELSDLMEGCRRLRGERFRAREFNDELLSYGTIPPRAVRRLMLGGSGR